MLKQQMDAQGKAVDTIVGNMRVLEGKLGEAKMKKDTLKARAQSAKSARYINDVVRLLASYCLAWGGFPGVPGVRAGLVGGREVAVPCADPPACQPMLLCLPCLPAPACPPAGGWPGHQQRAGCL
jgi:phage shock protein A